MSKQISDLEKLADGFREKVNEVGATDDSRITYCALRLVFKRRVKAREGVSMAALRPHSRRPASIRRQGASLDARWQPSAVEASPPQVVSSGTVPLVLPRNVKLMSELIKAYSEIRAGRALDADQLAALGALANPGVAVEELVPRRSRFPTEEELLLQSPGAEMCAPPLLPAPAILVRAPSSLPPHRRRCAPPQAEREALVKFKMDRRLRQLG